LDVGLEALVGILRERAGEGGVAVVEDVELGRRGTVGDDEGGGACGGVGAPEGERGVGSGGTEYVRSGKLRALGVTTTTRSTALPEIATVSESVRGFESTFWGGIGVPKNTPAEIVDKLNREINAILADPKLRARFAATGGTVLPGTPADFSKLIADETEKWGKVVKFAGIKAE
jgi:Tripartite tricarboxylate transporter family receptor